MAVIRTMQSMEARRNRVIEMFYLVMLEVIIDLLSVATKNDQMWSANYEQHMRSQPFVRALVRAAKENTKHLEGTDGYTKMAQKLGENRWSIREYGIQEGWFETGRKDNVWNDVARRLWDNAVDCIEGLFQDTDGTLLLYPEFWGKKEVRKLAKRKRGIPETEIPENEELNEILEALPENELKINFQAGLKI